MSVASIEIWKGKEYVLTEEQVRVTKEEYPLDTCTCHRDSPCTAHFYIMVAQNRATRAAQARLDAMTIQDFLDLIKARDE